MQEFNQFQLYSLNCGVEYKKNDVVDDYIDEVRGLYEYDDVKKFVEENFGDISGVKLIDYPDLSKKISIVKDEEKIEICAVKNGRQYFGQGWKLISQE